MNVSTVDTVFNVGNISAGNVFDFFANITNLTGMKTPTDTKASMLEVSAIGLTHTEDDFPYKQKLLVTGSIFKYTSPRWVYDSASFLLQKYYTLKVITIAKGVATTITLSTDANTFVNVKDKIKISGISESGTGKSLTTPTYEITAINGAVITTNIDTVSGYKTFSASLGTASSVNLVEGADGTTIQKNARLDVRGEFLLVLLANSPIAVALSNSTIRLSYEWANHGS